MTSSDLKRHQPYYSLIRNSSYLTDIFPAAGGKLIDSLVYNLMGNQLVSFIINSNIRQRMKSVTGFDNILVVSDLNIGDAVIIQAAVSGIRDFLPFSRVDYIVTGSAAGLVGENPEISNFYPVLTGKPFPHLNDYVELRRILNETAYDLVINFCPMFGGKRDFGETTVIHGHEAIAPSILRNESVNSGINHIIFQSNRFIHNLLSERISQVGYKKFKGVTVTISDSAINKSREFLEHLELSYSGQPLILYNPDASSPYTLLPLKYQADIVNQLLAREYNVLLACGYGSPGIEKSILNSLPGGSADKITLIPYNTTLAEMAVITDGCDLYLGGDTGPLHIAAARKVSSTGMFSFRNCTAIFSVFGATPRRIYGYDSETPGFLAANQDSISRAYASVSPSRNITCIDKKNKVCRHLRCFESLDTKQITGDIAAYLSEDKSR